MPEGDKCIIVGDFNARRGRDSTTWPSVLGPHSTSKANSNRHLLPYFFAENKLTITNSYFQLPNKLKTTWTHGHHHKRARHFRLLPGLTWVIRGVDHWTEHRLLISKELLKIRKSVKRNRSQKVPKKFCVSKLKSDVMIATFQEHIEDQLQENSELNSDVFDNTNVDRKDIWR